MLKYHDTITDHDALTEHPDTTHELTPLPGDVTVPDDLSSLDVGGRQHRPIRWLGWTAVLLLLAGGAVFVASQLADDTSTDEPATAVTASAEYETQAKAYYANLYEGHLAMERRAAVTAYYADLYAAQLADTTPVYDLKQHAIDDALAELHVEEDVKAYYVDLYESMLSGGFLETT